MEPKRKSSYIRLEGSEKILAPATKTTDVISDQNIEVTIRLRRKDSIEESLKNGERVTHAEYEQKFGASDEDIQKIQQFAHAHQLSVSGVDKARRSVMLKGTVANFENAFQVKISCYKNTDGEKFRGIPGDIHIPEELKDIVEGVFGLDDRPQARPMFQVAKSEVAVVGDASEPAFWPNEISKIYGFPGDATGKGQCIGIIELGGGYRAEDLSKYFADLNISNPSVVAVSVDNAINNPSNANSADAEVMLDIEIAGAVAPDARIVVYFAPNTDKGFLDAITTAIHDAQNKPSVISISWGSAEKNWTKQSLTNFNEAFKAASLLGVTICTAAGDQGSADNETDGNVHADFPSSSPYVLACGGTRLVVTNNEIDSEVVWHDSGSSATGGGISDFFPLPDYQQQTNIPVSFNAGFKGRGLPDVAANADPNTGYKVLVDGEELVVGGTSAVAPLMAGLIAIVNQNSPQPVGFIHPRLYASPGLCRDIVEGNNITTTTNKGYKAGVGWDACTGWGVLSHL